MLIFDVHPQRPPSAAISTVLAESHTGRRWDINSALLGAPQARESSVYIYASSSLPVHQQIDPPYLLDVRRPLNICDCLPDGNRNAHFLEGELHINYHNSSNSTDPSSLGYIKLPRNKFPLGVKVRADKGKIGVVVRASGEWAVCTHR